MSKNKPCPFCGGQPYTHTVYTRYVDTNDVVKRWKVMCGARVDCCTLLNDFATEAEALAAWNKRVDDVRRS